MLDGSEPPAATIYHLEGLVDAVNLAVSPDGTFFWTIDGCDFFGGDCALWARQGSGMQLEPVPGKPSFRWVHNGSFGTEVTRITLRPGPGADQATADGVTLTGVAFQQLWIAGRICPRCGGLGPISLYLCPDPLAPPPDCEP